MVVKKIKVFGYWYNRPPLGNGGKCALFTTCNKRYKNLTDNPNWDENQDLFDLFETEILVTEINGNYYEVPKPIEFEE